MHQVENGGGAMPAFKGQLTREADPGRRGVRLRRRPTPSVKTAPEMTKPARGRGGNRRSHVSPPDSVRGEPARRILQDDGARRASTRRVISLPPDVRSGEGGIRTLEAGISPPNALAGRRLQPLGHFSGRAHRTAALRTRKPARGRALGEAEGEGFEPSTHLSARTRFPVALLRPLGHPSERGPS